MVPNTNLTETFIDSDFTYSLTLIYSPATYCVLPTAVVISFM